VRDPLDRVGAQSRPDRLGSGSRRDLIPRWLRRFWRIGWDSNITGLSAMVAYNMLLGIVPIALLGLFIAGQVLSSSAVQHSVLTDLQEVFPGTAQGHAQLAAGQHHPLDHQHRRARADRQPVARVVVLGGA